MPATSKFAQATLSRGSSSFSSSLRRLLRRRPLPLRHLGIGSASSSTANRQRLAKEIAFIAHPHARDLVVLDLHHAERVAAGFQDDDVAWLSNP
jgi:hypothetical protein